MKSTRVIRAVAAAAAMIGLALAAGACGGQSAASPSPSGASPSAKGGLINASGRGMHMRVHWNLPKTVDVSGDGATATTVAKGEAVQFEGQNASDKDVRAKLGDVYIIGNNPGIGRPDLTLHVGSEHLDPISLSEGAGGTSGSAT